MINYAPFCEKQVSYIRQCFNSWLNIAEGGKRAGKNIINLIAWAAVLEEHPDKLHVAAGVSVASAKLNIIDSNGFGLKYLFAGLCREGKYLERDALFIQTKTGEKVILISGGGKEGDERYIKGNSYGTAYVTEANECAQSFIKEIFDRTISSFDRKIFMDLNPKNPAHWFYTEVLNMHQDNARQIENYRFNYGHFSLYDNLSLDDNKIRETLRTYNKLSLWYKRDILGERVSPEGIIYDMWTDDLLFDDEEYTPAMKTLYGFRRYIGIDYGTTNPMVFLDARDDGKRLWLCNEYYWSSKERGRQKTDSEYADDLIQFVGDLKTECIILDPSAASFKAELRQRQNQGQLQGIAIIDADNEVLDGIRTTATMMTLGLLRVYKTNCPNFQKEVTGYVWDEKAAERGEEQPVKQNDHCMDAVRYVVKTKIKPYRLIA